MTSTHASKLAAAAVLLVAATGCATVPGDPYYGGGYAPTPVYGSTTVYPSGVYPVYPAYAGRDREDRWEDMRNDRERRAWRERKAERERDQRARDEQARRDLDRQRDQRDQRDQWARQQRDKDIAQRQREQRERELAQRQRDQRARSNRNDRNTDGSPRTDYDRYNPKSGQWQPRSEDMP